MKFLEKSSAVHELEKEVKNKWRWMWLEEHSDSGVKFEEWCRKIDVAGTCFCVPCGKTLIYATRGKKALSAHANDPQHVSTHRSVKQTCTLDGAIQTTGTKPSLSATTAELKSVLCCFLAEHCLPFSLSQSLVDLAKRLSVDKGALSSLSFGRACATYTTTHGVAVSIKEELSNILQHPGTFFSLNVDEATNKNNDKIVNALVQYFDPDQGRVVIDHLGSREVNVATAINILHALTSILQERGLGWDKVVSVLMDNCNTMRGKKGGVETLIRKEQGSLLDIGGETIHVVHTSASHMFAEFDQKFLPLQELAGDLYYDIEESSAKASFLFSQVQEHLYGKKARSLIRPISNRFLQMQQVADRLHDLWDALVVFYFCYLTPEERRKKSGLIKDLFKKHATPEESQAKINTILEQQGKQHKSASKAAYARKDKILLYLFQRSDQLRIAVETYRGILSQFSGYVKLFQSETPLIHKLHSEMFMVMKRFFSLFLDPRHIPEHNASALLKLDPENKDLHLRDRQLAVGEFCREPLRECLRDKQKHASWLPAFFDALRSGYVAGAKSLKKLPLMNKNIIDLSALDPGLQRSASTSASLLSLADKLPNVIPKDELGKLDIELKEYTCDSQITHSDVDETAPNFRIDTDWWVPIFHLISGTGLDQKQRYPVLSVLVKALLSIFSGPIVEGSFNIMGDIIEEDRACLTTENYEAIAIIKQRLKATRETAVTMKISEKMKTNVQRSYQRYQLFLKQKKDEKQHLQPRPEMKTTCPSATQTGSNSRVKQKSESTNCSGKQNSEPANSKCSTPSMSAFSQPEYAVDTQPQPDTCADQIVAEHREHGPGEVAAGRRERKEFFNNLSQTLELAARSGYSELKDSSRKSLQHVQDFTVTFNTELNANDFLHDREAADLYPQDGPNLVPVCIVGDGNCLPRSASLLAFGTEDWFGEMRARIVIELVLNEDFYLTDDNLSSTTPGLSKFYAQYSDEYNLEVLTPGTIRHIYRKEAQAVAVNRTFMGIWQLHAVASILKTEVLSIFPTYGGHNVRCHLHRPLQPRTPAASTSRNNPSQIPGIMWTRTSGKELPEKLWRPNHFVACLPGTPSHPRELSRKRMKQNPDIRSFFSKRIKT